MRWSYNFKCIRWTVSYHSAHETTRLQNRKQAKWRMFLLGCVGLRSLRRMAECRGLGRCCYLGTSVSFLVCCLVFGGLVFVFCCLVLDRTQVFCESMQELFTNKRNYDRQGFVLERQWRKKMCEAPLDQSARTKVSVPHDDVEKEKSF